MSKTKKKGSALGKVVVGAGLAAAAAGAAVLADKKRRKQIETKAKNAVSKIKADPRAKEIGADTADFLGRVGKAIKDFFK